VTDNNSALRRQRNAWKTALLKERTSAAMREARAGKLPRFKNAKALLRELNEGD
jgi:hypothetical protein